MNDDRLWRGGGADGRAVLGGLLLAPAALVLTVAAIAMAVGASLEADRSTVLRFAMRTTTIVAYGLCLCWGLPVFSWLAGRGKAGLAPLLLAGAVPGLLFGAWLAVRASGLSQFSFMAAGAAAACGAFVAAVFWFTVRSIDRK